MTRVSAGRVVTLLAAALLLAAPTFVDAEATMSWLGGRLVTRDVTPAAARVVELINARRFDDALAALDGPALSDTDRGRLAMAVAGHLDMPDPSTALAVAGRRLRRAAEKADDLTARRLLNEVVVYETVTALVLPWAPDEPGHTWVPAPHLLPARDLILAGDVDAGRAKLAELAGNAKVHALVAWQLAAFFAGDPTHEPAYRQLLSDVQASLDAVASGPPDRVSESIAALRPLLEQARRHDWAVLAVPADGLLYPRSMLEPMKTYYWWFRQMGATNRPMSKQGFEEIRDRITPMFPGNVLVKIYSGQKVPWGAGLRPDGDGAPAWAVDQVELRRRADHAIAWWFTDRQKPDGALGGGWEDDCEALRRFAITPLLCGNATIEAGIARLVDGIWQSGELVNGYDRTLKDIEHSSEMAADSSIMLALAYGDPLYFERLLETTRTTARLHTAVNARGHRHYRSVALSATDVRADEHAAFDTLYAGRAMRPAAMVAWYSRLPGAVDVVTGWSRAWCADALRSDDGKPAGIYPAAIRFRDGSLGGRGRWWEGLGGLYTWSAHNQDMVFGKVLAAWRHTRDDTLLEPVRRQFELVRGHMREPTEDPQPGSAAWAAGEAARSAPRFALWYRAVTGDAQFDDLVASHSPYGRFATDGDPAHLAKWHDGEVGHMRNNLPMITSEVRGTDRIDLRVATLLAPLSGCSVDVEHPPARPVTWRVGPDFAGVVRGFAADHVRAWAYSFDAAATRPVIRLWRLQPGRYALRVGPDHDADGRVEPDALQAIAFERRERLSEVPFDLPPRTLCHVEVVQIEPWPDPPAHLPDLAVMPRDIRLEGDPVVGQAVRGQVVVHNIGAADATDVTVRVAVATGRDALEIANAALGPLAYPADLVARTAVARFTWTPRQSGEQRLVVSVAGAPDGLEIHSGNNVAERTVDVGRP